MTFVSVTRLRIRRSRFLPAFLLHTWRSLRQLRRAPGFRGGTLLRDRRSTYWTATLWDDQAAMRGYMTTGAHRAAMPYLLDWCDEALVVHWEQDGDALPDWKEADRRMRAEGRPSKLRRPAPCHAGLDHPPPASWRALAIRPG